MILTRVQQLCLVLSLSACPTCLPQSAREPVRKAEALNLKFGVYTSDKATTMYRVFSPILEYLQEDLEKRLGRPVEIELKIFKSYEDGIAAIANGDVDLSRVGPASYIIAKRRSPGLELIVMEEVDGTNRFKGLILVRKDSGIRELKDLKGKKFAFGDDKSTIGRFLAQAELLKAGVYACDLAGFEYLGRHDKVVKAVELGDYHGGAARWGSYKEGAETESLRVIATYENVTQPWVARPGLQPEIRAALRSSMLLVKDPAILKPLGVSGFMPTGNEEYDIVRDGMKQAAEFEAKPGAASPKPVPVR